MTPPHELPDARAGWRGVALAAVVILGACAHIEASTMEQMSDPQLESFLGGLNNQQLCNGHNNAHVGPRALAKMKAILKQRRINVCVSAPDHRALGHVPGLRQTVYREDPTPTTSGASSSNTAPAREASTEPTYSLPPSKTVYAEIWRARVPANLRIGPGKDHEVIRVLAVGERVKTASRDGDWHPVETKDGVRGFVYVGMIVDEHSYEIKRKAVTRTPPETPKAAAEPASPAPATEPVAAVATTAPQTPVEAQKPPVLGLLSAQLKLIDPPWDSTSRNNKVALVSAGPVTLVGRLTSSETPESLTLNGTLLTVRSGGFFTAAVTAADKMPLVFVATFKNERKIAFNLVGTVSGR
jgi:uncharacterized protein YgiM (DUF1202 family)